MKIHDFSFRNINSCQVTKPECQLLTLFLRAHDSFLNFFYHITLIIKNFKIQANNYAFETYLSGNPGYQIGQPIQAGYLNSSGSINIINDRFKRFTVLNSDSNGQCANNDDSNRLPIKFGINMLTECKYK